MMLMISLLLRERTAWWWCGIFLAIFLFWPCIKRMMTVRQWRFVGIKWFAGVVRVVWWYGHLLHNAPTLTRVVISSCFCLFDSCLFYEKLGILMIWEIRKSFQVSIRCREKNSITVGWISFGQMGVDKGWLLFVQSCSHLFIFD